MTDSGMRPDYLNRARNAEALAARFSGGFCRKSWLEIAREYRELALKEGKQHVFDYGLPSDRIDGQQ